MLIHVPDNEHWRCDHQIESEWRILRSRIKQPITHTIGSTSNTMEGGPPDKAHSVANACMNGSIVGTINDKQKRIQRWSYVHRYYCDKEKRKR
jgi:hypothetical protein